MEVTNPGHIHNKQPYSIRKPLNALRCTGDNLISHPSNKLVAIWMAVEVMYSAFITLLQIGNMGN